jgi:hypothetical protein
MNPEERVILFCTQQVGLNEMVARFNSSLTGSLNCETFSEKNLVRSIEISKKKKKIRLKQTIKYQTCLGVCLYIRFLLEI